MTGKDENKTTVHDWTGLSQPLTKLVEVVSQGIGKHTASYYRKKEADDKAYELRQLATEMAEIQKVLPNAELKDGQLFLPSNPTNEITLQERYENRFGYQQARRQLNVESVTSNATEELLNDPDVEKNTSTEPVDPDWTTRFFQIIEEVSDEQMQQLWGKILAGEIKSPKTFSLRTLEFLRNLKKEEAEIFCKVGEYASEATNKYFVADFNNIKYSPERNNFVSFLDILILKEIGLLFPESLVLNFEKGALEKPSNFIYGNQVVRLYHEGKITFNVLVFTKVGEELLRLVPIKFDANYLEHLCKPIYSNCSHIVYSRLLSITDDFIRYDDKEEITLFSRNNEN